MSKWIQRLRRAKGATLKAIGACEEEMKNRKTQACVLISTSTLETVSVQHKPIL